MSNTVSSRAAIISRIRSAYPGATPNAERTKDYAGLPRNYNRENEMSSADRLHLFVERLREYDTGVYDSASENLSRTIASVLEHRGKRRLAVPSGLPANWLPEGFEFVIADRLNPLEIDRFDGVVTGCTAAIALTGSLILQNADAQGPRRLSLVPDYHLCIVFAEQVAGTVPEACTRLAATATLATTFISGPSATADIEMTRIKGVHGPRFLDVILVHENTGAS